MTSTEAPAPTSLVEPDTVQVVTVCGHELELLEFDGATRAAWLEHADAFDVHGITSEFRLVQQDIQDIMKPSAQLVKQRDIVQNLDARLSNRVAAQDERMTEKTRAELHDLAELLDAENQTLQTLEREHHKTSLERMRSPSAKLEELKMRMHDVRLRFVHRMTQDTRSYEVFKSVARGSDYLNAEAWVNEGNASWVAPSGRPLNRKERRRKHR